MKKVLITLMILCMCIFTFVSCNEKNEVETPENNAETNVAVETLEENEESQSEAEHYNRISIFIDHEIMNTAEYPNTGEMTAFELLKKICDDEGIELSHLDGYVNGIDGYSNTAEKGWVYYFNGEMPNVGPADYIITILSNLNISNIRRRFPKNDLKKGMTNEA